MPPSLKKACLLTSQSKLSPTVTLFVNQYIKFSTWFAANMLSLNLSKTNFMVFKSSQKGSSLNFKLWPILRVSETMFLGVFLDGNNIYF